jgi:pyruvate/2-oxoglutarate/acetoin dehydrogenase E1 component
MSAVLKSNSDNAARPAGTFAGEINRTLTETMESDPSIVLGGQLIKYGFAGLTTGLYERFPNRFITYSVSEELMNSSAMGLALSGKRVVMFHVRLDFLLAGMNSLFNHMNVWWKKGHKMPVTIIAQEGRGIGTGQGAQHSKDITCWFQRAEGWNTCVPQTPTEASDMLSSAICGDKPTLYVLHRRLFNSSTAQRVVVPQEVKLCGASKRHMDEFYKDDTTREGDIQGENVFVNGRWMSIEKAKYFAKSILEYQR